ncbi:hypothetical protein Y032_0885g2855 [Ancylostoma ceylanicum]|nr:hypothetical protein Y032_0885g2855 [Ancylostoma ceylanicum]
MSTLGNLEKGIVRRLRKKEAARREKIDRCFDVYRAHLNRSNARTDTLNKRLLPENGTVHVQQRHMI